MCHLRGLCFAKRNAFDRARDCYKDAVRIDVQCFEAFDQLMRNSLMSPSEELAFLEELDFESVRSDDSSSAQEAAHLTKMLYTTRLSKYASPAALSECHRNTFDTLQFSIESRPPPHTSSNPLYPVPLPWGTCHHFFNTELPECFFNWSISLSSSNGLLIRSWPEPISPASCLSVRDIFAQHAFSTFAYPITTCPTWTIYLPCNRHLLFEHLSDRRGSPFLLES